MSEVLPPGLSLLDAPYTFVTAIRAALRIISWRENLEPEYMPPKRIWLDEELLERHFDRVKKLREDKYKVGSGSQDEGWNGDMVENGALALITGE